MIINFVDGCFDGFHYGHVYALYQAKQLSDKILVGTHKDEEIAKYKCKPIFSYEDRSFMLKHCKYIDEFIGDVDYLPSLKTLNKYSCNNLLHGRENIIINETDIFNQFRKANKYLEYEPTKGISTTNLIYRIFCYINNLEIITNMDYIYLNIIFNELRNKENYEEKNVIVIESSWELFNRNHINYILDIKQQYPLYNIVCKVTKNSKYNILNQLERAIVLCGIKIIDQVILEDDDKYLNAKKYILDEIYTIEIFNNIIKNMNNIKIEKEKKKREEYKLLKEQYLDTNLYFNILKEQFKIIALFIDNINVNNNDIIIFDIDEVCLLNLMYTNNFYYNYLYDQYDHNIYNYKTGLNPLIKECLVVFDIIKKKNISYAFITARHERIRNLTIQNLELVNLNNYIELFTYPKNTNISIQEYKKNCRKKLSEKYNIICTIGDQLTDFSDEYNGIPFIIFNPFY